MNKQKDLWEKLAKKNSLYYINSDYGKNITEKQFNKSAINDFKRLFVDDPIISNTNGTILDIGCGIGRLSGLMSAFYFKVIGTDISSEMIKQAKERLKQFQQITFIETDGYTLPIEDNSVNIAFSYLVFQHMKTEDMIQSNFREVLRVLKPGGIFKVLLRTDVVDVESWWGGVAADETYPLSIGYSLIKKEPVENYGLWLWLKKP